jgi:hypothetical protein
MKKHRRCSIIVAVFCSILFFLFSALSLAAETPEKWTGIDEAVVKKIAREHGREARKPFINTDQGDLLLFVFLLAGAVGGGVAGYYWRKLTEPKQTIHKSDTEIS